MTVNRWRRARGLVGAAVTWGIVGALIGGAMFLARYQPWERDVSRWGRLLTNLAAFMGAGALWGSVCGLAFGLVLLRAGRNRHLHQLSSARLTLMGAVAGAAFPMLLYTPIVLMRGSFGAVPFYAMLTGISAVFGAVCARAIFALARRAPDAGAPQAILGAAPFVTDPEVPLATRDHVR
jgi:hypothetical protein